MWRRRDERFANQGKYKTLLDPLANKAAPAKTTKLFGPKDFIHDKANNTCICPAGERLHSNGSHCVTRGRISHKFTERMKQAIDSTRGRRLYSQRMAIVEPVFANLRHNKQLNRFTLRTQPKVNTQWMLYCLVHNIEKLAKAGFAK